MHEQVITWTLLKYSVGRDFSLRRVYDAPACTCSYRFPRFSCVNMQKSLLSLSIYAYIPVYCTVYCTSWIHVHLYSLISTLQSGIHSSPHSLAAILLQVCVRAVTNALWREWFWCKRRRRVQCSLCSALDIVRSLISRTAPPDPRTCSAHLSRALNRSLHSVTLISSLYLLKHMLSKPNSPEGPYQ